MAIVKWKFGQAQQQTAQADTAKQAPVQIVTADGKQFGLENFGNTCYANSVLQALYFCSPFRDLVIQSPDAFAGHEDPALFVPSPPAPPTHPGMQPRRPSARKGSITLPPPQAAEPSTSHLSSNTSRSASSTLFSALRALFLHIAQNPQDKGTVAPRAFIDKLRELNELFRSTMHQDAHEFLNYVLNKIVDELEEERRRNPDGKGGSHDDLSTSIVTTATTTHAPSTSSASPAATTLVHRLFEGTLTSETRCLTCETVSSRDESFLDLSVDIEQNSSITACLRQFSASEMLCQRNKFFCDSCCDLQEAEKRMKIKRLPNVLALHLKRFKYQEDVGRYIKLAYRVAFPLELRLFNTVDDAQDPDRLYKLFAIVVHIGNGPHHGHYITIVKASSPNAPGQWLVFDDDSVDTIKESDIPKYYGDSNSGSAYVLYYQAVDIDLRSIGLRVAEEPSSSSDVASKTHDVIPNGALEHPEEHANDPRLPPGLDRSSGSHSPDPRPARTDVTFPSSPALPPSIPATASPRPPPHDLTITAPPPSELGALPRPPATPTEKKGFTIRRKKTEIGKDAIQSHPQGVEGEPPASHTHSSPAPPKSALPEAPPIVSPANGTVIGDGEPPRPSTSTEKDHEKEKDKKSGSFLGWPRRKSIRASKNLTPLTSPSPMTSPSSSVSNASVDSRFNTTGHAQPAKSPLIGRQVSEQAPKSPFAMIRQRSEQGSKRPTTASSVGSTGANSGYGVPLPPPILGGSSSALESTSTSGPALAPPPSSGPPPLQPKSPLRANRDHTSSPPSAFSYPASMPSTSAPEHKKSMPQLSGSHRRDLNNHRNLPRPMSISHINGTTPSGEEDLPPVPPIPTLAASLPNSPVLGAQHAHFVPGAPKGKGPEGDSTEALTTTSGSSSPLHTTAPTTSANVPGNRQSGNLAFKRATRKLSFSGGMLGFGKKKDKGTKDVSDTIPTNFQNAAFTMGSRL